MHPRAPITQSSTNVLGAREAHNNMPPRPSPVRDTRSLEPRNSTKTQTSWKVLHPPQLLTQLLELTSKSRSRKNQAARPNFKVSPIKNNSQPRREVSRDSLCLTPYKYHFTSPAPAGTSSGGPPILHDRKRHRTSVCWPHQSRSLTVTRGPEMGFKLQRHKGPLSPLIILISRTPTADRKALASGKMKKLPPHCRDITPAPSTPAADTSLAVNINNTLLFLPPPPPIAFCPRRPRSGSALSTT